MTALDHTANGDEEEEFKRRKGKERAMESSEPAIFDVGDDEDEEAHQSLDNKPWIRHR